jgi:hypothetical protein
MILLCFEGRRFWAGIANAKFSYFSYTPSFFAMQSVVGMRWDEFLASDFGFGFYYSRQRREEGKEGLTACLL